MAAILVSSFSAGATIKRCPTAFSYENIDIDLSNQFQINFLKMVINTLDYRLEYSDILFEYISVLRNKYMTLYDIAM